MKLIVNKKYGLKNFYWPISHKEHVFSMKMFFNLIKNSQNYFYQNDKDNFNIFVCLKILLCHKLLDLYLKKKLFFLEKKYKHQKIFIDHKSGYYSKEIKLQNGLKKKNILFRYLRLFKNINSIFHYKPLHLLKKKEMNIVISNNDLILQYLKFNKKIFFTFPLSEWLYPCTKKEYTFNKKKKLDYDPINYFIKEIKRLFIKLDCKLHDDDINEIYKFIEENFFWARLYLERLDRKQELLPKNLITGTQGIVWVRLLSSAVKKYGGNVLVFDHAPAGDLAKESLRMLGEIDFADVFYTFNSKHVKYWSYLINKFKSKDFNLVIKKVKKEKRKIILKNTNYNLFKKKILLVAQPFMIHDFQMCCFPQPIQFNWHLKLIYNLKKFGYEVTYKPHPFSDKNIVKKLCKISAIKSKNKLLEEIYHQYDYLLFDCRSTSTWGFALSTNIPIIFIDFLKFNYFHEDNLKLKKRVSVIKGKIDKYNNPIINFNKLKYVIHYSEKLKTDKTFFNSFIN